MQNVMQLESSYYTNKRKRKASEAFEGDFDYLYGIVTTGKIFLALDCVKNGRCYLLSMLATDWYFIMYTPESIYCTKADYHIVLTEDILENVW